MKVATFIVIFVVIVPAAMALANQVIKAQTGTDFGWLLGIACGLVVGAFAGFFSGRFVKSLKEKADVDIVLEGLKMPRRIVPHKHIETQFGYPTRMRLTVSGV